MRAVFETRYQEMSGWPGTVPEERMERALRIIRDTPEDELINIQELDEETGRDVTLLMIVEAVNQNVVRTHRERDRTAHEALLNWRKEAKHAAKCDTYEGIGGIIAYGEEDESGREMENRIIFQVLRHPEWMGANAALPMMSGMNVILFESEKMPGRPGVILAQPPRKADLHRPDSPVPGGEAFCLLQILAWHGAEDFTWVHTTG